jgi:hypothetical protein
MSERIKLVQGDNLPIIRLTLKNADGTPLDVSGATVKVYFRAADSDTVLSTLICIPVTNGSDGVVQFNFTGNTLQVDPGLYEGEVEVDFGGLKQTVYDVLKFNVRQQFA